MLSAEGIIVMPKNGDRYDLDYYKITIDDSSGSVVSFRTNSTNIELFNVPITPFNITLRAVDKCFQESSPLYCKKS